MSRLVDQIKQALAAFVGCKTVREYFALFKRTELLDELLAEIADKPT